MEKTDARTLKPEVQEQLRKQAIQLRQKGHSILQIAAILDVNPRTVYRWCQLHKRGGAKSIRLRKRGRPLGACRKLTAEQEKQVQRLIRDKQPDQLKLAFALWSRIAVQQLIKQLWAMRMPIRTVGEYLKRWGFIRIMPPLIIGRQEIDWALERIGEVLRKPLASARWTRGECFTGADVFGPSATTS